MHRLLDQNQAQLDNEIHQRELNANPNPNPNPNLNHNVNNANVNERLEGAFNPNAALNDNLANVVDAAIAQEPPLPLAYSSPILLLLT